MGTLYQEIPPLLQDLKITVQSSTLLFSPLQRHETPNSMFLSNIDQVLNFDVQTLHFFAANPDFPPEKVAKKLEIVLEKLLVHYDFLAGRIKLNPETNRLEFDCNNAGIGFVVACSEHTLDELGDLVYPNPGFEQLITQNLDGLAGDDHPLCIFQVTSFKCGGFAMGVQTNHTTFDGLSFKAFLQNLAALASDLPLPVNPFHDRRLLAARSPPRVSYPHPELLKLKLPHDLPSNPNVFDTTPQDLDFKVFRISSSDISALKTAVTTTGKAKPTGFNSVSAHIWKCKALSLCHVDNNPERESTILYAIDIRPRLKPPLPVSYTGNAVLTAYATAKCRELKAAPLGKVAEMVAEGSARMTEEYARSAIDWGEMYKGFPHGEFLMSSWWRLGFSEVEYPWGKPKYSCPLVYRRKDIILLFPDIGGDDVANGGGGVNVLVALPHEEMTHFETLFHKFLKDPN